MKPKLMDYDTDWEQIKETQLNFLVESDVEVGIDHRFAKTKSDAQPKANEADRRETILRALVSIAAFN